MSSTYTQVTGLLIAGVTALVVLHVLNTRYQVWRGLSFSGQMLLVKSALIVNLLLLICYFIIIKNGPVFSLGLLYLLLVFNVVAYMYFHFFNMSETSRRVKLLIMIHKGIIQRFDQIEADYHTDQIVKNRLERLEAMGQVRFVNGKYRLTGYLLLTAALLISNWKKILHMNHSQ